MIVISELYVENFRGIRRCEESLKLSDFNILIGKNNAGKTTILEALFLASCPYKYTLPLLGSNPIDFIVNLHSGRERSLVYGYIGRATIGFKAFNHDITLYIMEEGYFDKYVLDGEGFDTFKFLRELSKIYGLEKDEDLCRMALYVPGGIDFFKYVRKALISDHVWNEIVVKGAHTRIVKELVNHLVSDRFTELLIVRDTLRIRKEVSSDIGPLYVDVDDLGSGIKRLIAVALCVEYIQPRIILWDDIEFASHPGLIEAVVKWLARKGLQVVIATHSIDVIVESLKAEPPNMQLIILKKTSDDIVKFKVLKWDDIETLVDKGVDVRKMVGLV